MTNPGGQSPHDREDPSKVFDGDPNTKWLDLNFALSSGDHFFSPKLDGGTYQIETVGPTESRRWGLPNRDGGTCRIETGRREADE